MNPDDMNMGPPFSAASPTRDLPRLAAIIRVLVKTGWRHYIERLPLRKYLPGGVAEAGSERLSDAVRLRLALEELGATFIKFGQMLSVRRDLFPEDVITEFQKLQDAVPPFPATEVRRIIAEELEHPVNELFDDFEDAPLAAASIAQVHAATLRDGASAIVKVQRPGIEQKVRADLAILFFFARLVHAHIPESRRYDPIGLVEEFADTINREFDFTLEGHNMSRFSENFKNEPGVYVPHVYWGYSSGRVLTMERSSGHRAEPGYPADPAERKRLAALISRTFLTQLFEHGFFHGDPHPGNLFIMGDGRLCFHDFGIVGRLSAEDQDNLGQLFLAVSARDAEWMADVYLQMGIATPGVDRKAFARDLGVSLERYYETSAHSYSFGEILRQYIRLGQHYEIRMPREFLLVAKAFMIIESQARALDPEFNMIEAFQSYIPRMIRSQLTPDLGSGLVTGYRVTAALRRTAMRLPGILNRGLGLLQEGKIALPLRHEGLDEMEKRIDRASNRLSFSLIISAVVVASSIVMSVHAGPHFESIPLIGLVGYAIAALLGLWWAMAIMRSGKF